MERGYPEEFYSGVGSEPWKRKMERQKAEIKKELAMDKNTFGSGKGAENLVDVLSKQEEKTRKKASRMLEMYLENISQLHLMTNDRSRRYISKLLVNEFKCKTEVFPVVVKTHLDNVATVAYRKAL